MTDFISSIAVDNVIDALKTFMTPFMQGGEVIRGQTNRVPMPADPCAVLTELLQVDIEMPYSLYDNDALKYNLNGPQRIDIQIDFYGSASGELCKAIKTAFRTEWGIAQFPSNIKPLYTDDGRQMPLTTGEQQYENRWTLTASLQYNPIITVPQQSADVTSVAIVEPVDILEVLS